MRQSHFLQELLLRRPLIGGLINGALPALPFMAIPALITTLLTSRPKA